MIQIGPCYQVSKTHCGRNLRETTKKATIIKVEGCKGEEGEKVETPEKSIELGAG